MKVATAQYQIEPHLNWQQYTSKITSLMVHASAEGCDLVLLPEYAGVEIGGLHATDVALYQRLQIDLTRYLDFYKNLAREFKLYIQPGTIIIANDTEFFRNRAYFFSPQGEVAFQDKLNLIEYEKNLQIIQPSQDQTVFETALGKIGIVVCYDIEFPAAVSNLTQSGAVLILVPSYTISLAGYHRVSLCARARAIENQCYVAVSYVVGQVLAANESEQTFGRAGVFTPIDQGFSDDGILSQGKMNQPGLIMADLNMQKIIEVRQHGSVHNFQDALTLKLNSPTLLKL